MHWRRKWQPTPVFLPGESQGRGSLVGCRLWGRTELDKAGKGQSGTSTLPLELPTSEQIWRSPLGEAHPFLPNRGFLTQGQLAACSSTKQASLTSKLRIPLNSLEENRFLEDFFRITVSIQVPVETDEMIEGAVNRWRQIG